MSDENEMVTIQVPVSWAQMRCMNGDGRLGHPVDLACKAALDARKTRYERWLDDLMLPWNLNLHSDTVLAGYELHSIHSCSFGTADRYRLIAAAPLMLEALIEARKNTVRVIDRIDDAIKAAVPADVAAEILGEQA